MNFMSLNIQGLAQKAKKDWVKELCVNNKVNFLSLQETKMEEIELFTIKACWGNFTFDHMYSPSVGFSGGILCVWDPKMFHKTNHTVSDYFIMVRGTWIPSGKKLLIISVCAPQELSEKKDAMELPNYSAEAFNSFIARAGLEEILLGGCSFTWCHKSASKMSKLDRFLISKNLMSSNPNINATTLDRYLSDHRPIFMREAHFDYGPIPFRFFHYWFEWDGFDNFVEKTWNDSNISDTNTISKLMKKLKYLKEQIRVWIKDKKEKANRKKKDLKDELSAIDSLLDKGEGNSDVIKKREVICKSLQDFEQLNSMEAQKVKIKWAIEGDENSKYYHGILNKRRSHLAIRSIMVDGTWIDSPNLVKDEFLSHFTNRFDQPQTPHIQLDLEFPYKLNEDQNNDLESNVNRDEIKRAVWDCGTEKSPGPDGFSFGSNSSFIALIPKTHNANMVKDYRPITLIGSLYKIISKILANRLTPVLGDMVNEVQSAFVANRQILDGPFILNELFHWCKMKKKQTMIFKVDFEKAYDSVWWDYLDEVLKKFSFGERWCGWIQSFLRSSRGSDSL
ncbi:RNA-directed DNA polymerase, eukaryota [Tanacetum coccineum]